MEDDTKEFNKFVERLNRTVEHAKKQSEDPTSFKEVFTEMKSLSDNEQATLRGYKKEYDRLRWLVKRAVASDKDKKELKRIKEEYPEQQYIERVEVSDVEGFCKIYGLNPN